ncbi:MAG: glycosyltransferase family 2 protein [Myxococcales bacterium]|nr:glycosyltransferase family 2 protein [Myxococcales bacterium]MCB9731465.1 glycosyltransferase family 2 protein [Deltaproteobacteria bacterium]
MSEETGGALVSVVVPVYNGERTLRRALESVVAQAHRPLEIVVVDDGSTDGTAAVVAAVAAAHPDVDVRRVAQENAGPARARNRGIAEARGELLAFNDADDAWLPEKLATQLAVLADDQGADFTVCAFQNVADEGFEMPAWAVRKEGPDALPGFIFQAMLARRRAFEKIGDLDETMRWAEDTDWFLRAFDLGLVMRKLDTVLVHRFVHDRNLSGEVAQSQRMLVRAVRASLLRKKQKGAAS